MQRDQLADVGLVLDDEDTGTLRVFRSRRLINSHVQQVHRCRFPPAILPRFLHSRAIAASPEHRLMV